MYSQVSAGQHMHMNGDLKNNNISVTAQQGIFFNQQHTNKAQASNMNSGTGCNSNINNPNHSQPNNNSQSMTPTVESE